MTPPQHNVLPRVKIEDWRVEIKQIFSLHSPISTLCVIVMKNPVVGRDILDAPVILEQNHIAGRRYRAISLLEIPNCRTIRAARIGMRALRALSFTVMRVAPRQSGNPRRTDRHGLRNDSGFRWLLWRSSAPYLISYIMYIYAFRANVRPSGKVILAFYVMLW